MQLPVTCERVEELLTLMEEQLIVLEDLAQVQGKMSELLAQGRIVELDVLLKGNQVLLWRLSRLEDRRFRVQEWLATQHNLSVGEFNLSRLTETAPNHLRPRITELRQAYSAAVEQMQSQGRRNSQLLQQGLACLDVIKRLVEGATSAGTAYRPGGGGGVCQSHHSGPRLLNNLA